MKPLPGTRRPVAEQVARFPASGEGVDAFHAALDRLLEDAVAAGHPLPSADAIALRTAVGEVVANIIEHACPGVAGAQVSMALACFLDRVEATFEDPGIPFDPPAILPPDALPQGGLGLSIVHGSMDGFEYSRVGEINRWRLVRRLGGERHPPA